MSAAVRVAARRRPARRVRAPRGRHCDASCGAPGSCAPPRGGRRGTGSPRRRVRHRHPIGLVRAPAAAAASAGAAFERRAAARAGEAAQRQSLVRSARCIIVRHYRASSAGQINHPGVTGLRQRMICGASPMASFMAFSSMAAGHGRRRINDYDIAAVCRLNRRNTLMIDLHYWTTPNGHKVTMFLEETGTALQDVPGQHRQGRAVQGGLPRDLPEQPHPGDGRSRSARRRQADLGVRVRRHAGLSRREDRKVPAEGAARRAPTSCNGCSGRWAGLARCPGRTTTSATTRRTRSRTRWTAIATR